MRILSFVIIAAMLAACGPKKYDMPHVLIETNMGDIELELYDKKAPQTVAAFLSNVDKGYYKDGTFYRVLKDETLASDYNSGLIQGGINNSNPQVYNSLPGIPHESPRQTGISHTSGIVSMARTTPGSAKSEFFICIGDQTQFDSSLRTNPDGLGYAAFGKVVEGMPVVRKIQAEKSNGEKIIVPVRIINIRRL